jgi:hypothetical protein
VVWEDILLRLVSVAVTGVTVTPPSLTLNGGAIIRYTLPAENDLLGAKAVYSFAEDGELMEIYASAFNDSIVLEGYPNTDRHTVLLYAVDKSGNLSLPVSVPVQPLTPPVEEIRKTLKAAATFSGVRVTWENPMKKPIDVSLYTNNNLFIRAGQVNHYIPGGSASFLLPVYLTVDMGKAAMYSRFKYYTRGRSPVYSAWVWYLFEVWGTNNPKACNETGDGSQADNLKYWTSWSEADGTDAWKNDWEQLADCEIIFPSGTPNTVASVTSAEDIAFVRSGFEFDVDPDKTSKPFRYIRFVLKKNNTVPTYVQWSELQFWGAYAEE